MDKLKHPFTFAIATLVAASSPTLAATVDWTGGTSADWNISTNWAGGQSPGSGDVATFSGTVPSNKPDLSSSDQSVAGLSFGTATGGWSVTNTGTAHTLTLGTSGIDASAQTSGATILSVATLALGASQTWTVGGGTLAVSSVISGANGLTTDGAGTVILTGANTYAGATTVNAGTLQLGNGGATGALAAGSSVAVASGATFYWNVNASQTFANAVSGAGVLQIRTAGDLSDTGGQDGGYSTVSAASNTGGTVVLGGLVSITSTFGSGAITLNGGGIVDATAGTSTLANAVTLGANGGILRAWGSKIAVFSGVLSGSGQLTKTDLGTVSLTNANNVLTGNIRIGQGTLSVGGTGVLNSGGTYSGTVTIVNSGSLAFATTANQTLSGVISGTNATLSKTGASGTLTLTGTNTYTGLTTVYGDTASTLILAGTGGASIAGNVQIGLAGGGGSGGTLQLGANNQLASTSVVTFGHAYGSQHSYFKLNGYSTAIGGLQNGADLGGEVLNGAAAGSNSTLTLSGSGTYTYGPLSGWYGTISNSTGNGASGGTLAIVKSGNGTQTFTGGNAYTGGTTVTGGTLITGNTGALGGGAVSVTGGVLQIGNGSVKTVTLGAGASLVINGGTLKLDSTLGTATAAVTLAGAGGYTFDGTLDLSGVFDAAGVGSYTLITGGTGTKTDTLISIAGYAGSLSASFANGQLILATPVPEPSDYGLLGAGVLGTVAFFRRRRRATGRI